MATRHDDALAHQVEAIHDTGVVGVSVEVLSSRVRLSESAGAARWGSPQPMPAQGRFRIGSATKTFTAAVVLQLVGEGRLSLSDTVERWLPGVVRGNGHDGNRITVRDLLRHTSGIPDVPRLASMSSADGYRAERLRTYRPQELVDMALRQRSAPVPDSADLYTAWSYSNTNYVLAAMLVGRITGRSWEREVTDRIIRPLGLHDTSVPGAFPLVLGPHAHAYTAFGAGHGGDPGVDVTLLDPSMATGSGSVISTTHDVNRFYAALFDGRLLDATQLDEMTATVPAAELGDGVTYGLGLAQIPLTCGGSYFGHRGELLGYRTWAGITRDGSRSVSVYVTSDGGPDTEEAMMTLMDEQMCAD
ncbi:serine hydrolase domain-containing protein [Streptomyces sp. BK208]|uniref:serine hydrolase domain-containing protein n=1 Tax=Streptomyces sp. BK208 TaxID=2512150 RepID=UPI001FB93EE0|nr:serine hydrolase domain-containing protein [Streptomyces sp. BK208]